MSHPETSKWDESKREEEVGKRGRWGLDQWPSKPQSGALTLSESEEKPCGGFEPRRDRRCWTDLFGAVEENKGRHRAEDWKAAPAVPKRC